jgi:hypothetical protein
MSLAKGVAGFIVSSLFIISLYLTISSYTIGDLVQRDSIKSFVESQTEGEMVSQNCEEQCSSGISYQNCEDYCSYLDVELREECKEACLNETKQNCIQMCLSQFSNKSQQYIYDMVDEVYNKKIVDDISLDNLTQIFRNTILLLVLSLIFGFSIFFVSDKPISKLGNNLIVVSISLLSIAVIPMFIISPDISIIKMISDYILEGLYLQLISGVILIVIGIILIIIGKKKGK